MVADVPVLMQLLFQQSLQYVFVKVPRIQFIVRLCEHAVVPHRRVPTVKAVQKIVEIPQVQFLERLLTRPSF